MKKYWILGIFLFILSAIVGFFATKMWITNKMLEANLKVDGDKIVFADTENKNIVANELYDERNIIETEASEEKVSPNTEFALKKYYSECGHFKFEYVALPMELINLTEEEVEQYYDDWEVEEFSSKRVVLVKDIASLCDEHYIIKLGNEFIEIYHLEPNGEMTLYKTTDISKEYLTQNDIKTLQNGYYVFGEGKLNSVLEDFE